MNYEDALPSVHSGWVSVRDSGWLSAEHCLTEAGLKNSLGELCRALQALHSENLIYAAVSPDHVYLDQYGVMQLQHGLAVSIELRADSEGLYDVNAPGFAAYEQYVDDPAWPIGPWTDIYGVCALARTLILKQCPPDAVQRIVRDTCEPLQSLDVNGYSNDFLGVIDRGMSLLPQLRFASIDTLAGMLDLPVTNADEQVTVAAGASPVVYTTEPAATSDAAPVLANEAAATAHSDVDERGTKKAPVWMIAAVMAAALIALGGWWSQDQKDETVLAAASPLKQGAGAAPAADATATPELPTVADAAPSMDAVRAAEASTPPINETQPSLLAEREAAPSPDAPVLVPPDDQAPPSVETELAPVAVEPAQKPPVDTPSPAAATVVSVRLLIQPWGEVFINGVSRGVSPPLKTLSLAPGEYRIKVVNGKLPPHHEKLTVQAGQSKSITHRFE